MSSMMLLTRKLLTTLSIRVLLPQGKLSLGCPIRQDSPAAKRIPEILGSGGALFVFVSDWYKKPPPVANDA